MTTETEVTTWVSPEHERKASQSAKFRARAGRWNLDIAIFLFGILTIVIILLFQGVGIEIVTPVSVLGLALIWFVGWRRGRKLYQRFYEEELAKYSGDWKDYYKTLHIIPDADSEAILQAHEQLSGVYQEALSGEAQRTLLLQVMEEVNEAYQVLSDPRRRAAYDHVFWLKANVGMAKIEDSTKQALLDLATLGVKKVSPRRRPIAWRIPIPWWVVQRALLPAAAAVFTVLVAGTSLAFAKPEHVLAAPFRPIAAAVAEASSVAISVIEETRTQAAAYECSIVSTALQSMRVDLNLRDITPVTAPTNDMAQFPSREYHLFPDYLAKRFSQFRYTVDGDGIVTVDISSATTDRFLENIKALLGRLEVGD